MGDGLGISPGERTRVYEQTLAAEYLRWMRAWIDAHPEAGFAAKRVTGTEDAPGGVFAGPRDAVVTDCFGLGYGERVTDALFDEIEGVFEAQDSIPEVECTPYSDGSLLWQLERRGYGVRNYLQIFWRDLGSAPEERVEGVEVRRVDKSDPTDVALAVRTIAAGMESTDGQPSEPGRVMAEQVVSCVENATFLAFVDGEVTGGSSAGVWERHPMSGPHANLYGGSTLPSARGKGVQRALMLERLRWAYAEGARTVSLDCKPMIASERNARRLGFELACTKGVFVKDPELGGRG
ncbi:MAG: GNAT family N-acetyltransferase [Planctomycetota bacterium]